MVDEVDSWLNSFMHKCIHHFYHASLGLYFMIFKGQIPWNVLSNCVMNTAKYTNTMCYPDTIQTLGSIIAFASVV